MAGELMPAVLDAPSGPLTVPALVPGPITVSVVVPTLNEGENIREFLDAVNRVLHSALPGAYEIIVVDDDSPDRTWELAAAVSAAIPALRVVRRRGERGLASAVIRGWQVARGTVIGTINADFQHPPELLGPMIAALEDADVVVASRYVTGGSVGNWRWYRRVTSNAAHTLGTFLLRQVFNRITDPLSGCYLARRECIAGVELKPLGYKTLMEIVVRGRVRRIRECPYQMRDRERGRSKAGMRQTFQYLAHLWRLRKAAR